MKTNNLERYRKKLRMSRDALANLLGVTGSTIYSWEHENTHPRRFQIERLEMLLGVNPGELGLRVSMYCPQFRTCEEEQDVEYCDMNELEPLLCAIDSCGEKCLREVIAYLWPDSLQVAVRKLKKGLVKPSELDVIRRVLQKYGGLNNDD